jgi:hypothetical protein
MPSITRASNEILLELVYIINALGTTTDILRNFAKCITNIMFCLNYQCSSITDAATKLIVRDRVDAHVSAAARSLLTFSKFGHSCCITIIRKELHGAIEVLMNAAVQY